MLKTKWLVLIVVLLAPFAFTRNVAGFFTTEVRYGQLYGYSGEVFANYGGAVQYGYAGPASDTDPQFYAGLASHADAGAYGAYVSNLHITVTAIDPNGAQISGQRLTPLSILHGPDDPNAPVNALLDVLYEWLANVDPSGIVAGIAKAVEYVGPPQPTGYDSVKAWGDWTFWGIAPGPRDHAISLGFELQVDPTIQGTYFIEVTYHVEISYYVGASPLGFEKIDVSDYIQYCFVTCTPNFGVSVSPTSMFFKAGTGGTAQLTISSIGTFQGTIALTSSLSPTHGANPPSIAFPPTVELHAGETAHVVATLSSLTTAEPRKYVLTFVATSGSMIRRVQVNLWVTPPPPPPTYVYPATFTGGGRSGGWITVCVGTSVSVRITLSATMTFTGPVDVQVRRDIVNRFDDTLVTLSRTVTLNSGNNVVEMGAFTPTDVTGTWDGDVQEYFLRVYWSGQKIYDGPSGNREWVKTSSCPGGDPGGSVACGSLITMADRGKVPVQNIREGDLVIVYDVETGYETVAAVTEVRLVTVDSLLTIHTTAGLPFQADANPNMVLHVLVNGEPALKPVTEIQPGDWIYNYDHQTWVEVTRVTLAYGGHHVMYDLLTDPVYSPTGTVLEYIANGYPDCPPYCKT